MRIRFLAAAFAAASIASAPAGADAGPISSYPAGATPLSGSETVIGTQGGSTVQITAASIAAIVTAATNSWTGVQTFPSPGANHGSIVLTPGAVSGTPPNGALWTTSSGVFAQIGGATVQFATGTNYATLGANTFTGEQTFAPSASGHAGVNLGQGAPPTAPVNGDLWITSSGIFAQYGGATQTLITGSNNNWPAKQSFTASTTGIAGVNFGVGTGPVAPANGDFWITNSGVFAEVNGSVAALGVTVPTVSAGGSNTQLQYNCSSVLCGSAFTITGASHNILTGPDGTVWSAGTGITIGTSGALNINGTVLLSGTQPMLFAPNCPSGAGGATWLIGPPASYCTNTTSAATDNICIGTITCGSDPATITSAFGNTTAGSENMKVITSGSNNSCFGFESCHLVTTASSNSALGYQSCASVTTGTANICLGQGSGADIDVGSESLCAFGCGTLETGSYNVTISGGASLTSGNSNIFIGPASHNGGGASSAGFGIATGHSNVWIGGQGTTLSDQSGSITMADGEGNILYQYLSANGYLSIRQPMRSSGDFIGMTATTVSGLTSVDSVPAQGDRGYVTDASSCAFNSVVSGGGSTKCPVVYNGSAWVAG